MASVTTGKDQSKFAHDSRKFGHLATRLVMTAFFGLVLALALFVSPSGLSSITSAQGIGTLPLAFNLVPSSSVVAESTVSGLASWTGAPDGNPTGTVNFLVFAGAGCSSTLLADVGTETIDDLAAPFGTVPISDSVAFPEAATYSWQASYSGDVNYAAVTICVDLTVAATDPSLGLNMLPSGSIAVDSSASGASSLTGATATAGGSVTYSVYSENSCTSSLGVANNPSVVAVTNAVVPESATITFDQAGTYYWNAVYGGDPNNNPTSSACVALTVNNAVPSLELTTSPAGSIAVDTAATGIATLTGATATAAGSVTYTVYSDGTCVIPTTPAQSSTETKPKNAVMTKRVAK